MARFTRGARRSKRTSKQVHKKQRVPGRPGRVGYRL